MIETILTETESSIDRQWRNMEFCYELMEQHREMEQYVNECLIKASGNKKAINEMYVLNEGAAGDKIKGFFTKIKNFFKKIFDKLGASLNGVFMEQKKYIDKYAYIVTKCKWMQGDISDIKDRFKGLPRIIDAVDNAETAIIGTNMDKYFKGEKPDDGNFIELNTFQSAQSIETAYNDENKRKKLETGATRDEMYNKFIGDGSYWSKVNDFGSFKETDSNGNVDINATFLAWFDGSKDTISYSSDEVENNFQTIINTVYAGQSYMNKLEKIVSSVTKKMDDAARNMENYHKAQQDKIMQAVKGNSSAPSGDNNSAEKEEEETAAAAENAAKKGEEQAKQTGEPQTGQPQTGQPQTGQPQTGQPQTGKKQTGKKQGVNGSAIMYNSKFNNYINEVNFGGGSTSSSDSSTAKGPTGAGVSQINNASKANENINKAQVNKMDAKNVSNTTGVDDSNKSEIEKKASELLDTDIFNRQVKINESVNISSVIVRKMFDSFKNTNKDFFEIIRAHVQWYLSNPGKEKETESQTTRTRSLNMNAGNEQVKKTTDSNKGESKPEKENKGESTGETP